MPHFPKIGPAAALLLAALIALPETRAEPLVADKIPVSDDYVLRTWEVDDGLPGNNVSSIAQTPDGYLWLVTSSGLSRFDGVRFTPFLKETTPGLESNQVRALFVDRDGALWVGLERGGVSRKTGDHFEVIMPLAPRTAYPMWTNSFAQDPEGAVWFGRNQGVKVFRWQKGTLTGFSIGPGVGTTVQADGSGRIWVSTLSAYGYFDGNRYQVIEPNGGNWPSLAASRDGGLWVKRGFDLRHYRGVEVSEVVAEIGDLTISTLLEDHAGNLWIGTLNAGLFRYRNGSSVRVPTSQTAVSSIVEDRQGNLWVGMVGGGLDRLRPRRFSLRQKKHGLLTDSLTSLCEDGEGRLWLAGRLAGRGGTVSRANDSSNQTFLSLEAPGIMAMCPDPKGGVWMATSKGLVRWQGGAFTNEPLLDPLTALLVDRQGDLWVATIKKGLIRWHNGAAEPVSPENGLSEPRALAEDPAGRLWVGTEAGRLFQRIQQRGKDQAGGGGFVSVPLPGAEDQQIRFIVPEKNGVVWVGANNGGLYRWRDGQIARLPLNTGLPVNDLRVLAIEPGGEPRITGTNSQAGPNANGEGRQFWFGTGSGMFRVAGSEIDAVMDGRQRQMQVVAYRRDDGMPNVDYIFGFKNTTTRTHDGHLWFATTGGALEIGPEETRDLLPPVPLLIEEVGGVRLSSSEKLTLPPRPGPLQIRYTLADLSAPEQVHFRYRLLGWEGDWVQAERQRTATFTHLSPGEYRFEVAAAVGNGPWLAPAFLQFSVAAAWWESAWFRLLSGFAGVTALGWGVRFIVRRRMRARMRRLEQENALERERTRIARDMHDDVGARLMRIALMSEVAASEPDLRTELGNQLGGIAHEAREVVDTLDEIVWTVNPRNDTLVRLIGYLAEASEAFLDSTALTLALELPKEIPAIAVPSDVRHHILLVVKEALNNVVKHARATSVSLKIALEKGMLSIMIEDDGSGFAPAAVAPFSNGLHNSEQRLASIGGVYHIESRLGHGAVVKLEIPLAFSH